jgi:DNA-directed RNA polymerase subunit M
MQSAGAIKTLKFCSECGTVMKVNRENKCLKCPKCGATEQLESEIVYSKAGSERDKIIVIGRKERNLRTTPQAKAKCPKCDNDKAYWWMVQTRGIDESATQFYRCTRCAFTWRDYS